MARTVQGIGVSAGIAVGPVHLIGELQRQSAVAGTPEEELQQLDAAISGSVAQLEELAAQLRAEEHEDEGGIMDAQALMLQDPGFLDIARQGIEAGSTASQAVRDTAEHFAAMFENLDDPYMAARAADVRDIAERLVGHLLGAEQPRLDRPSIVVAHDLSPSQTAALDRSLVLGFVTDAGSATSHTAILASALNIPAVVATGDITALVQHREEIALDGETGMVVIGPTEEDRAAYRQRTIRHREGRTRLAALRDLPALTLDGHRITLAANIGSPADLPTALEAGAEGVGLFRTEFLFAGRQQMPSEEEQVEAYRAVLGAMAPHLVVIRTLDVGGDKPLPYLPQPPEMNPFLGERGIRYTHAHPEILQSQIRALLRASAAGSLAMMFPMIGELDQVDEVMSLVNEVRDEVGGAAELGIMIEIPAAALIAQQLGRHVSFFSVGTNDLVQYGLAVDRTNDRVASLYRPLHPGILHLLEMTVEGAHAHGRWAGVCGEMAGDPLAIPLLVGMGFDELSMTPGRIGAAKEQIRSLRQETCSELALSALRCETADEVEALVRGLVDG